MITQNLSQKDIAFLKGLKAKGVSAQEALTRLQAVKNQIAPSQVQTTPSAPTLYSANPFSPNMAKKRIGGIAGGLAGSLARAKERASRGIESLKGITSPSSGKFGPQAAMGILGAVGEVAAIPFTVGMGFFKPEAEQVFNVASKVIPDNVKKAATKVIDDIPDEYKDIYGDAFASLGLLALPSEINIARNVLGKAKGEVKKALTYGLKGQKSTIAEKISPKITPTGREAKTAIKQGRVTKGKESILTGKKPDIIEKSTQIKKVEETIKRRIAGADDMDEFTLYNSMNNEVKKISEALKPDLQKVQLKPSIIRETKVAWEDLKKAQIENPDISTVPGFSGYQKKFESYLKELSKNMNDKTGKFRTKNLDDAWDVAIRYDNSISDNVKNASSFANSSSDLLFKKEMWLQNRKLLRELVTKSSEDLQGVVKEAFSDMHDLYKAMENIVSKGIDTTTKGGALTTKNLLKVGAATTGLGIGAYGVEKLF